jgi:ketosteroid isomerase-like protein
MSNADIAIAGLNAIARGDFDAISDLLDPDVKWHAGDPDADYACHNRNQALAWMRSRPQRGAGPIPELVGVHEVGDRVLVIMQPLPSDEDPEPQRTANLSTFRDGKVIEMVHYDDADDGLAALASTD